MPRLSPAKDLGMTTSTIHFAALFEGRGDAFGLGHGEVVREQLTMIHYRHHLEHQGPGLGIFPIREDNTVMFAAIDLDEPDFEKAADIAAFIPGTAWMERSRSGNAHLWVFFRSPCPAWVAQANLRMALEAAGAPRVEVFPKQTELLPGMVGNYINLPFYGDQRPIVWRSGDEYDFTAPDVPLDAFLREADEERIDPEHWRRLALQGGYAPPGTVRDEDGVPFGERETLHECATYMLEHKDDNPLTRGHRHVVLFNLAKMILNCRDYDEHDALTILQGYNDASEAPVADGEIESIVANAARGEYTSTGCDDPLMSPYVSPTCPIAHG